VKRGQAAKDNRVAFASAARRVAAE